jgi:hypothetical protein
MLDDNGLSFSSSSPTIKSQLNVLSKMGVLKRVVKCVSMDGFPVPANLIWPSPGAGSTRVCASGAAKSTAAAGAVSAGHRR